VVAAFMAGEAQGAIAEQLGVGVATIGRILRRRGVRAEMWQPVSRGKADQAAIDAFIALGAPPIDDALGAAGWLHRLLVAATAQVAIDPEINEATRRRQLVALSRAAVAAFPMRIIEEASRIIDIEQGKLRAAFQGPETVSAAELDARDRAAVHTGSFDVSIPTSDEPTRGPTRSIGI